MGLTSDVSGCVTGMERCCKICVRVSQTWVTRGAATDACECHTSSGKRCCNRWTTVSTAGPGLLLSTKARLMCLTSLTFLSAGAAERCYVQRQHKPTSSSSSHSREEEHITMSSQVWPVTLMSAPAAACTAMRPADFSAS